MGAVDELHEDLVVVRCGECSTCWSQAEFGDCPTCCPPADRQRLDWLQSVRMLVLSMGLRAALVELPDGSVVEWRGCEGWVRADGDEVRFTRESLEREIGRG